MQLVTSRTNLPQANVSFSQNDFSEVTRSLKRKNNAASLHPLVNFRGQFSVGELSLPVEKFSIRQKDRNVFIENFPTNSFPKIEIILEFGKDSIQEVKQFKVSPSDNSVQGWILYTRFFLTASVEQKCSLNFKDINFASLVFGFSAMSSEEEKQMLYTANISRKLRFIETVFEKARFNLQDNITPIDVQDLEILFRGLTEGEFTNPTDSPVTIYNYRVSERDLQNNFLFSKREFSLEFDEPFRVLERFFDVGKIIIKAEKASVANPRKIRSVKENEVVDLELNVFDSQIHFIFEKYKNVERLKKNKQKLKRFRELLQTEEPDFLASLLDDSLAEVNNEAAIETIELLLQYYDFPDRFSVLKPKLEKNRWRVPIALTYPNREPIKLADAFVDVKTGKVEMKISFEQLLKRGKRKAKEALSVA